MPMVTIYGEGRVLTRRLWVVYGMLAALRQPPLFQASLCIHCYACSSGHTAVGLMHYYIAGCVVALTVAITR